MKTIAFIAIAAVVFSTGLARHASAQALPETPKYYDPDAIPPGADPWSVVGQWHYASVAWRGMIDIRADGTFSRVGDAQGGKWKLGGADDQFVLILKWDHFAQDTVAFVGPTLFDSVTAKGEIIVRRLSGVAAARPPGYSPDSGLTPRSGHDESGESSRTF